jgi:peptidoglycan/LPS O-acetylase OafA/YrhL
VVTSLETEKKSPAGRLPELDAIRGIAAAIVVFHHYLLMQIDNHTVISNPVRRLLQVIEPVKYGHSAVLLFFVLSGLVLAFPYLRGKSQPYSVFLIRRVFRIYVPYLAALMLALGGDYFLHQHVHGMSHWSTETWSEAIPKHLVLQHLFLLGNYDSGQFNTAFWTLIHEMRISIIFPFLLIAVVRLGDKVALSLAFLLSVVSIILIQSHPSAPALQTTQYLATVHYTAFFVCGIILAKNLHRIGIWYQKQTSRLHVLFAVISIVLYGYSSILLDHFHSFRMMGDWLESIGATGIIVLGVHSARSREFLSLPVSRFLGRISYSLYLVHGTVLFTLTALLQDKIPFVLILPIYLLVVIVGSSLFCLLIEEPAMGLGRRISSRFSRSEQKLIPAGLEK